MMRFDRFTEQAQEAAQRAAEIIQRYGHTQIDTEHILLALIEQPNGVVPQILEIMSIDSSNLQAKLDEVLRSSPKANIFGGGAGQIFITPRVKRVMEVANEEATKLNDEFISTEHLFLAILSEKNTPASRILTESGVGKKTDPGSDHADPRRTTRDRPQSGIPLPHTGEILTRPDPIGARDQIGPGHRTG